MTISVFPRVIRDGLVIDFDPAYRSSFNERENLLLNSEQADQAPWIVFGSTTRTANQVIAPDGTLTADQIGNVSSFYQDATIPANAALTASVYVKSTTASGTVNVQLALWWVGGSNVTLAMNPQTGAFISAGAGGGGITFIGYTIDAVGNGWYRISVSGANTTGLTTARFEIYNNSGAAASYFMWGAQLERSRTMSNYVLTTAAAVTRSTTLTNTVSALYPGTINGAVAFNSDSVGSFYFNNVNADNITLPGLPATFWNAGSWSVSAWTKVNTLKSDNGIVGHGDITVNNALHLGIRGALVYFGFYGNDWASPSLINANRWYHIVWTYDNAQKQKTIFVDGVQVAQNSLTGAVGYGGTGTNTSLGFYNWPSAPSSPLDGWLGRVQMYSRVLAPAEVSQIFSSLAGRHGYGI